MKKLLLIIIFTGFSLARLSAQCVPTCSNYVSTPITYTPISAAGNNAVPSLSPTTDDGITPPVPIGFNFNFYCATYSTVLICSNGFLQFDIGVPPVQNQADATQSFPSSVAPNAMIALNMNDLDPTSAGAITYTTIGTAPNRKFLLTYSNVPIYAFPASITTGQIVLYETSNLIEIYTSTVVNNSTTNGTQGIENQTGTVGTPADISRNNVIWSAGNSAYRFSPTYAPATLTAAITGSTSLCEGLVSNYSIVPSPGVVSYNWALPGGWFGTSNTSAISTTVGSSGSLQVTATYTCGNSTPATLSVTTIPSPVVAIASTSAIICTGQSFLITPSGAAAYTLQPGNFTTVSNAYIVSPLVTTTYTLYGVNSSGCLSHNDPTYFVNVGETPTVTVNSGAVCAGQSFTMTASGADIFVYSTGFPTVSPPIPGIYTYSVTGTNTNGCIGVPAISTLTVYANPSLTLTANRTSICKNETATITASGADTYSWTNGVSTAANPVHPASTTIYSVTGTATQGGCSKTLGISIFIYECTGIAELNANKGSLSVYPNPSGGLVTVNTANTALIEIYDIQGKLVYQNLQEGEHTISLEQLNPGQYLLRAIEDNTSRSVILVRE